MEFYHLRSFVAVAQTGNLTQAAKRLYTTPPAISAHIKSLEAELATSLFTRSSKGMALTAKGQLLLTKAQVTLDSAVDLVNLAADNQHEIIGTFRLGNNLNVEQVRLAELAENLQENCPGISLAIQQQSSGKTLKDIRSQQLDGGYVFGEIPDDFMSIKVSEQIITTIAPLTFDVNQALTASALSQQPWIMMGEYCPFDDLLKAKLGKNIISVLKSSDDGTRLALVKKCFGLSFSTLEEARIAEKDNRVQVISALDFKAPLYFVVAKNRAKDPVVKALLQEIRILWHQHI
ncbi:LysR family transcriptional regulator [Colwellia psychrerythraea]|uniref:Transcriptional regulator, LysR family n=1 Tax=Colwellia psychrerythraea TaxID=28229 RepID=A0A099KV83_COLPS|nr:LysR family transcriptional regulator [Colwellia psychrerythraea]KGJ94619.1 transcriptional regulator, LysR family [Colwellia psychrerythraea]